ncbi:MAG: tetratricopeptide repeat protein [Rhodospirillales bacterium]|nr:tetratricopeptide repeat protein [Rhodospirillales bacterium]
MSEAESIYKQILQVDPDQPVALHLLGVIAHQVGNNDVAVELIRKSLIIQPDYAEAHNNLGGALNELKYFDEAVASYHKALAIKPDYAEAYFNLGVSLKQLNKMDAALASYQKAIAIKPDYAEAHNNLGLVLKELNKPDDAVASYSKALAITPVNAEAHNNLGVVLNELNRRDEAEASYHKALAIKPDFVEAHNNLGNTLKQLNKLDAALASYHVALSIKPDYAEAHNNIGVVLNELSRRDEAVASYLKALSINPEYAEAHFNLGVALNQLNRLGEAVTSYHKALAIEPDYAEAHNNLGVALKELNKFDEAVGCFHKALAIKPDYAEAHNNLGNVFLKIRKLAESATSFRKALAIKPDYAEAHSNLIFLQDFLADIDQAEQQAERKRWNDTFILPLHKNIKPHTNDKNPERRLRIGYVSADFRRHSACLGFAPLIIDHDRQNFDVICYDATLVSDEISTALRAAATHWRDIKNIKDEELANIIRAEHIDILVDLSGHSRGNRLKVFGYKPAPVQASGIGHLASGASTIDYRLTTAQISPPAEENIYPEKPIYLDTYFGFTPPPDAPLLVPPPCLQNGFITFGFLGRFSKTSDEVFALWAGILQAIPGSRLLLKYRELDERASRQMIKDTFSGLGISEDRLTLLGKTQQREHLEHHNRVDIMLDTFPHGGGITTLESLWMGVPVIGLVNAGKAGGRVIDCVVRPVGLEDWIAHNIEEYHALALGWAGRTKELAQIRQELRQRVADVYFRFPQDVEKSYRLIWRRWCQREKASPLYPLL